MPIKSITPHCYDSLKTLPGFETTFYVPLADAMTNALCRQGVKYYIKVAGQKYLVTRFSDEVCPFFMLRFYVGSPKCRKSKCRKIYSKCSIRPDSPPPPRRGWVPNLRGK
jgi:hypothetical protein